MAELHWKVLGDALVRFLQNSGPVFTKFGQVLATRHDLLPPAVCARLEALYSRQPSMPRRELEQVLARAYGRRLPFRAFRWRPIAVGSIGQVHRARLRSAKGSRRIIVKILRPGIGEQIERDLSVARVVLSVLLGVSRRHRRGSGAFLTRSLEDLARSYAREADLRQEADSLRDFKRRFQGNPKVAVPKCYEELSSGSILVMEELRGEPLTAYRERSRTDPRAARKVADLALQEILRQIFADGRFHADPHAGNLLILEDGRLGIIDLGLTGELSAKDRKSMARAVRAFLGRDVDALIRALLDFGVLPPDFDLRRFQCDVLAIVEDRKQDLVSRLKGRGRRGAAKASSGSLDEFVTALFQVAHDHRVYVPPSTTLFLKTLVTIEGVARSLNPDLNLVAAAFPVILRSLTPRWMRWVLGAKARAAETP